MSRYDLFRRRLAPIALFLALGLMAKDACDKDQRTHATVVFDFGAAEPRVRGIDAELWMRGEEVATFHRAALAGFSIGPTRFPASLPTQDGELRLDVDLGIEHRKLKRLFHADEGATVLVRLGPDLR